jgi:hypothetical protein
MGSTAPLTSHPLDPVFFVIVLITMCGQLAASRPSTGPALSSLSVTDLPTPTPGSQPASRAAAIFAHAHLAAAVCGPVRSRARLGDPAAALDLTPRGLDGQG